MRRQRAVHPHMGSASDAVMFEELSGEPGRPTCIVAVHHEVVGLRRGQEQRRRRGRSADSAKPPAGRPPEIEDSEVQPGVRLDTYGAAFAAGLRANQESLLSSVPPMTEACEKRVGIREL
jgi:hypothetical protein